MSILNSNAINKIKDAVIREDRPFVYTSGKNLFNKEDAQLGIINNTGSVNSSPSWSYSSYINVIPGSKLILNELQSSSSACIAFYDENKNVITTSIKSNEDVLGDGNKLTVPYNAHYLRFSIANNQLSTTQLEYGNVSTEFEEYLVKPSTPNFRETQDVKFSTPQKVLVEGAVKTNQNIHPLSAVTLRSGKNLFNKGDIKDNTVLRSTGVESNSTGWFTSNYIPIVGDTNIVFNELAPSGSAYIAFYGADKQYIEGSSISNADIITLYNLKLTTPSNAAYLRFTNTNSVLSLDAIQLEYGKESTAYKSFDGDLHTPNFINAQEVFTTKPQQVLSVDPFKTINFPHGKNLFNKDTTIESSVISDIGLPRNATSDWLISDFIPVLPNNTIKLSHTNSLSPTAYNCFYDINKEPIITSLINLTDTNSLNGVLTVPPNAYFFRTTVYSSLKNSLQIEYGNTSTSFEKYSAIPTLPSFLNPQEVIIKNGENISGYKNISSRDKYSIHTYQLGDRIMALHNNVVVKVSSLNIGGSISVSENGINGDYLNSVVFNNINFPNLESASWIQDILIIPFQRNMTSVQIQKGKDFRIVVITNLGQIYHNYPARSLTDDGVALEGDIVKFDESVVWELEGRKHPSTSKTASGVETYFPGLKEDNYKYRPAVNQDNGYGNGGFPKSITHNGVEYARFYEPQKNGYHSMVFMGGYEPTSKLTLLGTYRSNTAIEAASRICVFATSDGGRSWYTKYEFAGKADGSNSGIKIDASDSDFADYTPSSFKLNKVTHVTPNAEIKEPTTLFELGEDVIISSIAKSNPLEITTLSAHGLTSNSLIVIQSNSGVSADWDWLKNDTFSTTSGGNGRLFKVEVVSPTKITLREYIHNPFNNITCRHIHSINRVKDGFTVGCGERHPEGWMFYVPVHISDDHDIQHAAKKLNFIRLTSTKDSLQRTLGFIIKDDADSTVLHASDDVSVKRTAKTLPEGRTDTISRSSTGIFKGKLADIDDLSKYEVIFEAEEPAYFFKEKNGVYIFCGQRGEAGFSFDEGKTWHRNRFSETLRLFRGMSRNEILVDNTIIVLK